MREPTREEYEEFRRREHERFGTTLNLCQSLPPRHTPYTFDGRTFCTTCGEELTDEEDE